MVSWVGLESRNNNPTFVYDNFSIAAATDKVHAFEYQNVIVADTPIQGVYTITDVIGDTVDAIANSTWLIFDIRSGPSFSARIYESGVNVSEDSMVANDNANFVDFRINATGGVAGNGQLTVVMFSDAGKTTEVDRVVVEATAETLASFAAFVYPLSSRPLGAGLGVQTSTGHFSDLDLDAAVNIIPILEHYRRMMSQ